MAIAKTKCIDAIFQVEGGLTEDRVEVIVLVLGTRLFDPVVLTGDHSFGERSFKTSGSANIVHHSLCHWLLVATVAARGNKACQCKTQVGLNDQSIEKQPIQLHEPEQNLPGAHSCVIAFECRGSQDG